MGRPCSRRVVLRDHGTERRKRLPTMGTAPKTQEQVLQKNKIAWTPKECSDTSPTLLAETKRDSKTDKTDLTPYHTLSHARSASSQTPTEHRNSQKVVSRAAAGRRSDTGPAVSSTDAAHRISLC